jgi:phosphatidylglycerophosphate synthase
MAVTSLRLVALKKEAVISASSAGKHKTISQMFSIFLILIFMFIKEAGSENFLGFWDVSLDYWYKKIIVATMMITVILTVSSGISYFYNNRNVFFSYEQD